MIQTSLGPLEAVLEFHKGHNSGFSARNFQNSSGIHLGTPGWAWKIDGKSRKITKICDFFEKSAHSASLRCGMVARRVSLTLW